MFFYDSTDKKIEAMEQEVSEQSVNPQADAPKKNAVAAEPSHIAKMADYEDLGAAVVKPTDSNPDATKKIKQVSGDAQQKSQGAADPMPKLKEEQDETEEGSEEIKEGEMPKAALDALKKHKEKSEEKEDKKDEKEEVKEMDHMDKDKKKMDEYKIQKSADNADHADSKSSPVKTGGAKMGGTPIKTGGGAEDKGRPAPTAQKMSDFENTPGKDKGTSMKKEVKPQTADGSEKSAKSPISGK